MLSGSEWVAAARSWLFVPGSRPDRFARAFSSGADAVIFDLEDAVAPDRRPAARVDIADFLAASQPSGHPRSAIRVSAATHQALEADLHDCLTRGIEPDAIVIPKAEDPAFVSAIRTAFDRRVAVIALVESAAGILAGAQLADAADAVMIGDADLAADLGARPESSVLEHARLHLRLRAAAQRRPTIASPWFDLTDVEGLRARAVRDRGEGFSGKAAVHPAQLDAIHDAFEVGAEELTWAREVLERLDANSIGTLDGQMIDDAMARRARALLATRDQHQRYRAGSDLG